MNVAVDTIVMREILCCGCGGEKVQARLTHGSEIYPHRKDLYSLPFWKCDACGNFVGNLGQDPETKALPSGSYVTNISVATSESWKDKQTGQQQERTEWH